MALVLGIDASTQSISAVVATADTYKITASASIKLDSLGFGTTNGVLHRSALEVVAPSLMFCAALDALLAALKAQNVPLQNVVAVSGCGQQHGSVFWATGAEKSLKNLDPKLSLKEQLKSAFCVEAAPIWMDSSTTAYCQRLEADIGGPDAVAALTGSRAYERFTGNQIAKIIETQPNAYAACERIGLISSMFTSLLAGKHCGIDESDASGMNVLDIRTRQWVPAILDSIAGENGGGAHLATLLGAPAVPFVPVGSVSEYFVTKYGFSKDCLVIPFTGDNPSTLAGLGISASGDLAVSLGTSDTAFAVVKKELCKPNGTEGHVLLNPVDPDTFIVMLCFKNGSLAREKVRDAICPGKTWEEFNALISQTPVGNNGTIGFFHPEPEITPPTAVGGSHVFATPASAPVTLTATYSSGGAVSPAAVARAIIESQMLRLRHHAAVLGVAHPPQRVLVSGGASANAALLHIASGVLAARVCKVADEVGGNAAAAYGGALRAAHGVACARAGRYVPYAPGVAVETVAVTVESEVPVYDEMSGVFGQLEAKALALTS